MPLPKPDESQDEFIGRCIPYVLQEGTTKDPKQATAICYSLWRKHKEKQDAVSKAEVQTVILSKQEFPTLKEAKNWCKNHDFKVYTSRETSTSWRFRQAPPDDFVEGSFRTKNISAGVSIIIGRVTDAVVGNFSKVKKQLSQLFANEKNNYALLIDKYIQESFNESVRAVAEELSLEANSLLDFNKSDAITKVLKENAKTVTFELFDAIEKELTLYITNLELNDIPFTTAGLKAEIRKLFEAKQARLISQVVTENSRAASIGLEWGYKQSGVITHKQWVAILDDRTTNICLGLNGEIVEIGQPFSTGDYQPPAHISCRSRIVGLTLSPTQQ